MSRKVKRGCSSSPRRSRRARGKKSLTNQSRKKKMFHCGCRKKRQSRKSMRGSGYGGSGSGSGLGGAPISTNKV